MNDCDCSFETAIGFFISPRSGYLDLESKSTTFQIPSIPHTWRQPLSLIGIDSDLVRLSYYVAYWSSPILYRVMKSADIIGGRV